MYNNPTTDKIPKIVKTLFKRAEKATLLKLPVATCPISVQFVLLSALSLLQNNTFDSWCFASLMISVVEAQFVFFLVQL